MGKNNKGQVRS